ncbi:TonB-dependent siderophore receptor [Sphingobacterium hotanense]|uniref:TonB-dependent siderophore receptor n=1 Tax=Sphingobacterium hotanense TaxID=649196 RepID=UPI0011F208BC|nr:TonB-dependent siderophore receptor [Sphingobacterium hotanense]
MQYNSTLKHSSTITMLFFLLLVPFFGMSQQRGQLAGEVFTMDGKPLAYASVKLKNTSYGTSVTTSGSYTLSAPAGNYTLVISYANYSVREIPVRVIANETTQVDKITVQSQANQLREVIVSDIQRNKFSRKETSDIARMPLANLQNAQAYSVVTKELVQEMGATDFNSAMSQVAGAVASNGVNDSGNEVFLRGFNAGVTMRNGLPSSPRTANEIYNLERIEVLKGPSATLFGAQVTSYGGVVNSVTKKPFESFRGEVAYTTGSWGMNRITADVNTPLNSDRTALARFNVMGMTQNGFQDAGKQQAFAFATSLLFKPNDRTTVSFDADIYVPEKTLLAYMRNTQKLTYGTMDKVPLPYDRALLSDDIMTSRANMNVSTELAYKISDHWTSRTSYQFNQSGDKESIFFVPTYLNDNQIERRYRIFDRYNLTYNSLQQNFVGDFFISNVKNTLVAGVDYSFHKNTDLSMSPAFLTFDTVGITDQAWNPITRADILKSRDAKSPGDSYNRSGNKILSGYLSNVTNVADRLFVMLSLSVNHYMADDSYSFTPNKDPKNNTVRTLEGYEQTSLSPKFGLVYQPIKGQLSLFANYMNSFRNMAASQGLPSDKDLNLEPVMMNWKPEQANQYEFGAKGELLDGRINTTLSYYNIDVTNSLREVSQDVYVQDGKLRSRGIEFDFIANPISGWNIIAGYGYNDIKYVKSIEANMNKRKNWAPKHVANVWTSYKFLQGSLTGFGLGAGINYVDKVYLDVQEVFAVPAYTTVNATAFYDKPKYRIGVKLNNLGDIQYWDFYGKPQKPFEILANLSFKF